jgi:hypothetical protein
MFHGGFSMIRVQRFTAIGVSAAGLILSIAVFAAANDITPKIDAKAAEITKPAKAAVAKAKPTLNPELAAIRDQVRGVLTAQQKQPFNTRQNSATEIQAVCLAFGCNSEVSLEGPDGRRFNGVTCLCWNYPCNGFEMLGFDGKHIAARIGYGYQEHPGEFLATLAVSRVPDDYPIRVGKAVRKVADLVEAEKLGCRSGGDASLKLIGLSYYVSDPEWKNDLGETWSLGRMIDEELAQPIVTAPEGGTNRLMALSYAVSRRAKQGQPLEGQFRRAQKYVNDFHDYALRMQNADGSWGPYFLATRAQSPDAASQLRTTGRLLEWLAMSLPEQKLTDPRMINAVECVTRLVGSQRYQWNTSSLSTQEIVSLGHALHGLAIYDQRAFKPFDDAEKPAEEKEPAATASRRQPTR